MRKPLQIKLEDLRYVPLKAHLEIIKKLVENKIF